MKFLDPLKPEKFKKQKRNVFCWTPCIMYCYYQVCQDKKYHTQYSGRGGLGRHHCSYIHSVQCSDIHEEDEECCHLNDDDDEVRQLRVRRVLTLISIVFLTHAVILTALEKSCTDNCPNPMLIQLNSSQLKATLISN